MKGTFFALFTLCVTSIETGRPTPTHKAVHNLAALSHTIEQKPLPYPLNGLEPVMSQLQLDTHYNKHHKGYVEKLNKAIKE